MRRREFMALVGSSVTLLPLSTMAQQPTRTRHLAWLGLGTENTPSPYVDALRAGLRELGWVEGQNLAIGLYWATGRDDMEASARRLLAADPEVIVTQELMTFAIRQQETKKPVVFGFSGDPADAKLVQSFARPGTNFTGMSYLALELVGKRMELLKELLPQMRRVAILLRPQHPGEQLERQASEEAAHKLGIEIAYFPYTAPIPTRDAGELDQVLRRIAEDRCDGLVVFPDSSMYQVSNRIAQFAADAKLPSVSGWAPFARNGLLLSYGPNIRELYRSLARYVDAILRGAEPAQIPVAVPTTVELVLNRKTATSLNLSVPPTLLARADEVIE